MNTPPRNPSGRLVTGVLVLIVLSAFAPTLIALGQALLPLVIVGGVVAVAIRLVFFHTRNW